MSSQIFLLESSLATRRCTSRILQHLARDWSTGSSTAHTELRTIAEVESVRNKPTPKPTKSISTHIKIEGQLWLAHEENDQLSITTEIIKYDENLAVVKAVTSTNKGSFPVSAWHRSRGITPSPRYRIRSASLSEIGS